MSSVSLHFQPTVESRRAAETCLNNALPGRFVTWRLTDEHYFISYCSAALGGRVEHLQVQRLPGARGGFLIPQSREPVVYPTFEALVASKLYLNHEAPAAEGCEEGGQHDAPSTASPGGGNGLRRRVLGDTGGEARLPPALAAKPPARKKIIPLDDAAADELLRRAAARTSGDDALDGGAEEVDESRYERGVPAFLPPALLERLLSAVTTIGVVILAASCLLRLLFGGSAFSAAARLALSVARVSDVSIGKLYAALNAAAEGSTAPAPVEACTAAVGVWRGEMEALSRTTQASLDVLLSGGGGGHLGAYLAGLGICAALAVLGTVALFFVHTGRPPLRLDAASIAAEQKSHDMFRPMQWRWTRAFLALAFSAVTSATLLTMVLWALGEAPTLVEHAARTLSSRFPFSGLPPSILSRYASTLADHELELALLAGGGVIEGSEDGGAVGRAEALGLNAALPVAWRLGLWNSGTTYGRVPRACLQEVASAVDVLSESISFLRLPLGGASSRPVVWGEGGDVLVARDPLRRTLLWGWLDTPSSGRALAFLLPSQAALAQAAVVTLAFAVISIVALLMLVDAYYTTIRPCILFRWWRLQRSWGGGGRAAASDSNATARSLGEKAD